RRQEAPADRTTDAVASSHSENRFHDEALRSQAYLTRLRGKIDAGLAALDTHLGSRPWLVGNSMTLADLAICCHLGFLAVRMPQFFPQDKYTNLARLWKTMEAREAMKKTVPPPA
ncbi:MAG: glutathione S-transferase C-terminal domain-containing protein, partial [Burkholderiales bacterium]